MSESCLKGVWKALGKHLEGIYLGQVKSDQVGTRQVRTGHARSGHFEQVKQYIYSVDLAATSQVV